MGTPQSNLPPGFRFHPTDAELILHYLRKKIASIPLPVSIIAEVDIYKLDPWELPAKASFGEKEWYFFSPRDRKYPNGSRPNRVAGSGYWKATGTDKIITTEGRKVGIKKALVFYIGKAPKGTKTNWIMHEYRLLDATRKHSLGSSKLDDWVLCRIYKKNSSSQKEVLTFSSKEYSNGSSPSSSSHADDMVDSFPEIDDRSFALPRVTSLRMLQQEEKLGIHNMDAGIFADWVNPTDLESIPEFDSEYNTQGTFNFNFNDHTVPSVPPFGYMELTAACRNAAEEEVQSGMRTQRVTETSGLYQHNSNMFLSGLGDPFGFKYSGH